MPRTGRIKKRIPSPEPIYGSRLLHRFINRVMVSGKKSLAQRLVYDALEQVKEETKQNPMEVFERAVKNVSPKMEVKPRRVGGASYQVPVEVKGDRREALAIRWLIMAARSRSNKEYRAFDKKLAAELVDAAQLKGGAIKRKEDIEKTAAANRAFAHFRW